MAVVSTANTSQLAGNIAYEIYSQLGSNTTMVDKARDLVDLMGDIPDGERSLSGGDPADGYSWVTAYSPGSASHTGTWLNDVDGNWVTNGTSKIQFSGKNLNGADNTKPTTANAFSYNLATTGSANVPGYVGTRSDYETFSASTTYDLATPNTITLSNTSYTSSYKATTSGYFNGTSGGTTTKESASIRQTIVGDMNYLNGTLTSAGIQSINYKYAGTSLSDGTYGAPSEAYNDLTTFSIQSASALTYTRNLDGTASFDGVISNIAFYAKSTGQYAGLAYSSLESLKYPNGTMPPVDLAALAEAVNNNYLSETWRLELLKGDDVIRVSATVEDGVLQGGMIEAGAGNDRVIGGNADDDLSGEAGNDLITGGNGNDDLNGGDGADILKGGNGNDLIEGGDGDDLLDGGAGNDRLETGNGANRAFGGAGNDYVYGGLDNDYLDGGSGNDFIGGDDGNDTLNGGAGQDVIEGGAGDDLINGGAGNDLIIGGAGRDIMIGGTGIDGFSFAYGDSGTTLESADQIKGFSISQDQIMLQLNFTDADIQVLTKTDLAAVGTAGSFNALFDFAEQADQKIVVAYDNANTYIFADLNDDGTVDSVIQLVGIKGDSVAAGINFAIDNTSDR